MKPNLHNPYGYKVCYKEKGGKEYIRHFLTYTYSQARQAKMYYIKYPQRSREDDHLLDRPEWVIIPVKNPKCVRVYGMKFHSGNRMGLSTFTKINN